MRSLRIRLLFGLIALWPASALASPGAPVEAPRPPAELRSWIEGFKAHERGPFARIRWFCADGTVHPPKPYPCEERGGGIQHGEWSERALELRRGGYAVANVLAELAPADFVGRQADLRTLRQILLERFLIEWDDGWILRRARYYRGAFQSEDEEAGARRLVLGLLADPAWQDPARFLLLRETVRLLPLQREVDSAAKVRRLANELADRDGAFESLRAKIHGAPDAGDAGRVRAWAAGRSDAELRTAAEGLAQALDGLFAPGSERASVDALARRSQQDPLAPLLARERGALAPDSTPEARLAASGRLLEAIREALPRLPPPLALLALQTSLALEREAFAAGSALGPALVGRSRRARLALLDDLARALYGTGLLGRRHRAGVEASLAELTEPVSVKTYRSEVQYLARAPEWAASWLGFHFGAAAEHLAAIEPEVRLFAPDRLRGSPLLFYSQLVDGLTADANRLAGVAHELFGEPMGAGLRALNPGLARGALREVGGSDDSAAFERDGIYLLPETTAELPPVAGILTRGEGSSLSHVQLLARNLGIPNVVVGATLLPRLRARVGARVVLGVSPGGVVRLAEDGPGFDSVFERSQAEPDPALVLRPDLARLDLRTQELLPLGRLRAVDSGRLCGPKGANLGELRHAFGDAVPDGFVIPFGVFRRHLERPLEPGGPSVFDWMRERYAAIAAASDAEAERRLVEPFLARLRQWMLETDPGVELRERLRESLGRQFGEDGSYGVFVRSDTNVEDLPGFTGAGLNRTVPNVVGFENVVRAVQEVWASPFTERAFAWRQSHMERPEYVFASVVVQRAFPAEKSGVMVTADVDTGDRRWLSVAVSEGVGGAVEGQAAESLRVPLEGGRVRFLAQATAPERAALAPEGGVVRRPASGAEAILERDEVLALVGLARGLEQFPALIDASGAVLPADVEFAFGGGRLALLQIRPFVESGRARRSAWLRQLDAGLLAGGEAAVDLDAAPSGPVPSEPGPMPADAGEATAG